jgi:hypothetical protein
MPFKLAKGIDKTIVRNLIPVQLQLKQLDELKKNLELTQQEETDIRLREAEISCDAVQTHGIHSDMIMDTLFTIEEENSGRSGRARFLNTFQQSFMLLSDLYYRCGYLRLTEPLASDQATASRLEQHGIAYDFNAHLEQQIGQIINHDAKEARDGIKSEAFFQIYTAATLNHKSARFLLAVFLENGLLPSKRTILESTSKGKKFNYLVHLVDVKQDILFKYLNSAGEGKAYHLLAEFEADTKT